MAEKNKKKTVSDKIPDTDSIESCKNKIITFLKTNNKKLMPLTELAKKCRTKKKGTAECFDMAFDELRWNGIILVRKGMRVGLCSRLGCYPGKITRLSRTFGFAETDDGVEYFIPGKCMLGAMPEDKVLISEIPSRTGEPEGEIVDILEYGNSQLTGIIEYTDGGYYFVPDTATKNHMIIVGSDFSTLHNGDKVLAEIVYRGRRHSEHKVAIVTIFGDSEYAASCADAVLAVHGVDNEFPTDVLKEARKISEGGVQEYCLNNREDLREMCIFTIDGAESKDLDDAISVEKTETGYLLGVHIADVSHYVKGNSAIDKEALSRGTSIYYADKVIPMLPKELSNGICSLNAGETRLTLSCFMNIAPDGEISSFRFCKSAIRSRVKGVYTEINSILDGTASPEIIEKYSTVSDCFPVMNELADILTAKRKRRGSPELNTPESKIITDENGICIDVKPRISGKSERIIEEFMLSANESAARLAREKKIPFVYRVHENPPEEKIYNLCEILTKFNIKYPLFTDFKPSHAAEILRNVEGTEYDEAVNLMLLRAMAKAEYSHEPLGHFGLALDDYAHFTSPIRRYPDLAIHRIITDVLAGYDETWLNKRYGGFVGKAAENSSNAEVKAVSIERLCENYYKAEFMKSRLGESFEGRISSVTSFGFYVTLENTIEGLVHVRSLPEGEYDYSEPTTLTERFSGVSYKLGDTVRVICAAANVSDGKIDFVLDDE